MEKNLVNELMTLFQGYKLETVQKAFKEAIKQVYPEIVTGPLVELFDTQIGTLAVYGCPQSIIDVLVSKKSEVITKAMEMDIPDGHIPFIPVIPRTEVNLDNLMKMIHNDNNIGSNFLDQSQISNVVDVPEGPYFIYDIEDGKDMLGRSPKKAEKLIKEQNRSCLTVDESIALCIHTSVLSKHCIDCTGSPFRHSDHVPRLFLDDVRPELSWSDAGYSSSSWGSPSCGSR